MSDTEGISVEIEDSVEAGLKDGKQYPLFTPEMILNVFLVSPLDPEKMSFEDQEDLDLSERDEADENDENDVEQANVVIPDPEATEQSREAEEEEAVSLETAAQPSSSVAESGNSQLNKSAANLTQVIF